MILEDSFEEAAPVDRVWPVLKDIPRVSACIPNATITEMVDDRTFKASVGVKVGPVSVNYKATITIESMDDETHTAKFKVDGQDVKGRGGVHAAVTSQAVASGTGTRVTLHTDAKISGIVATVGGRLIEGVAKKTVAQFAENLSKIV